MKKQLTYIFLSFIAVETQAKPHKKKQTTEQAETNQSSTGGEQSPPVAHTLVAPQNPYVVDEPLSPSLPRVPTTSLQSSAQSSAPASPANNHFSSCRFMHEESQPEQQSIPNPITTLTKDDHAPAIKVAVTTQDSQTSPLKRKESSCFSDVADEEFAASQQSNTDFTELGDNDFLAPVAQTFKALEAQHQRQEAYNLAQQSLLATTMAFLKKTGQASAAFAKKIALQISQKELIQILESHNDLSLSATLQEMTKEDAGAWMTKGLNQAIDSESIDYITAMLKIIQLHDLRTHITTQSQENAAMQLEAHQRLTISNLLPKTLRVTTKDGDLSPRSKTAKNSLLAVWAAYGHEGNHEAVEQVLLKLKQPRAITSQITTEELPRVIVSQITTEEK